MGALTHNFRGIWVDSVVPFKNLGFLFYLSFMEFILSCILDFHVVRRTYDMSNSIVIEIWQKARLASAVVNWIIRLQFEYQKAIKFPFALWTPGAFLCDWWYYHDNRLFEYADIFPFYSENWIKNLWKLKSYKSFERTWK